jgi:hypothetical protein
LSVVVDANLVEEIEETVTETLNPGESILYTMTNGYSVPWKNSYSVFVEVVGCEPSIRADANVQECANTHNLAIVSIDNPSGEAEDTIGQSIAVQITIRNMDEFYEFDEIKATLIVKGSDGVTLGVPYLEAVPFRIASLSDSVFTFTQTYTVPNDTSYSLTVSISDMYNSVLDNFPNDDIKTVIRKTVEPIDPPEPPEPPINIASFDRQNIYLGQNIPNPSNNRTEIAYSLPTDGSVTFNVYSISGQVLYSQTVETTFGSHSIDLNTSNLAAGLYFYSMEFKGQRLIKRMVVER